MTAPVALHLKKNRDTYLFIFLESKMLFFLYVFISLQSHSDLKDIDLDLR